MQTSCSSLRCLSLTTSPARPAKCATCIAPSPFFGQRSNLRNVRWLRDTRIPTVNVQASIDVWQTIAQLKGGAASLAVFLETAPPPLYLVYMLAAGFGLPCSEDALVVWAGSNIFRGVYGGPAGVAYVLGIIYFGVVVSDMLTFYLGVALQKGFFKSLKKSLFSNSKSFDRAVSVINKRSRSIGAIQRFSLGFRGPLCLVCGFTGVAPSKFALGAAVGALGTMPLQILVGYFLRNTPNPYLTAFAVVSAPNLFGQLLGPILSVTGLYFAGKEQSPQSVSQDSDTEADIKDSSSGSEGAKQ
ncbi:hypothetical protein ABBQ32_006855 [Trebouxia sp. C0010 RCD-2024]